MAPRRRSDRLEVKSYSVAGDLRYRASGIVFKSSRLMWLLWGTLALCLPTFSHATIRIVSTGERFPSHLEEDVGMSFWKGYEYEGRLQYIESNLHLCPDTNGGSNSRLINITAPTDSVPVALVARGGVCSLRDKANFILQNIRPSNLVRYLIVSNEGNLDEEEQPYRHPIVSTGSRKADNSNNQEKDVIIKQLLQQLESKKSGDPKVVMPLYIMEVSLSTYVDLMDTVIHETARVKRDGGTRVNMDGREGTGVLGGDAIVYMALSVLLSACACSFLLIVSGNQNGWWVPEEVHHHPPSRPPLRRLTREQVKTLLPQYRFDGEELQFVQQPPQSETQGLIPTSPPTPVELSLCSICLDDYEAGDRLRCLPCNHAFHAKCVGKWLAERSATCPLCKTELFEDLEEDEDDDDQVTQQRSALILPTAAPTEPTPAVSNFGFSNSWWDRFQQLASQGGMVTTTIPISGPSATETTAATLESAEPSERRSTRPSWWRRLLNRPGSVVWADHPGLEATTLSSSSLTEPLLSQPTANEMPSPRLIDEEAAGAGSLAASPGIFEQLAQSSWAEDSLLQVTRPSPAHAAPAGSAVDASSTIAA